MQNDPWDAKAIIIGIPTFLSTIVEYKDLSMVLEEQNLKFFCINMREHGWNGNCNQITIGTSIQDINELISKASYCYPNRKVFLLGQGFGAQLAHYIFKKNKKVSGVIIANPLNGTGGINFMKLTYFTFLLELLSIKPKLQYIDVRQASSRIDKMTNNRSYKREIKELYERKYIHGIPFKFIAQCRYIIDNFWKIKDDIIISKNVYWIITTEDNYQINNPYKIKAIKTLGNHLVFTDYINDEAISRFVKWVEMKIS